MYNSENHGKTALAARREEFAVPRRARSGFGGPETGARLPQTLETVIFARRENRNAGGGGIAAVAPGILDDSRSRVR
jgi:hypothetical protein